jgi:hypothetical protein
MRIKWLGGVATRWFKVECQSGRCVHEMAFIGKGYFILLFFTNSVSLTAKKMDPKPRGLHLL